MSIERSIIQKLRESSEEYETPVSEEVPEEELDESTEAKVQQSAQRVLNTYNNLIVELQTLKKGSGYCASSTLKPLTSADYAKRDAANKLVLDKLDDMKDLIKRIRDIVERAK